jgi:hypothetical protein
VPAVPSGLDLDLPLDLHRNPERQLGHADCRANVLPDILPVELQNQIGEAIDHDWLLANSGSRGDHSKHTEPGGDPIGGHPAHAEDFQEWRAP